MHNYLTHLNQNDILKIKIFQEFIFQIYQMLVLISSFSYLFKSLQPAYFVLVQGSNVPLSPKEYTRLHCTPKTIIIQCMHYYFDEMAKLQTYQHYFIHPPSTNIDLITKYVKCPILKYYFNYITHKTNVLQIWRTAITPQSVFFISDFGQWSSDSNNKIIMRQRSNNIQVINMSERGKVSSHPLL